ncbi:hypothetical protein PVAP13_5NG496786 [Panicum virgatum]|uniref:Uncharacterized protein n=1 Tax=Panicum virgatum TaxID=38727 RepID=A0A8T0RYY6_PANVG|nr:hypothetical protein PVAP13_5NG496786 [Panicum virgatum]
MAIPATHQVSRSSQKAAAKDLVLVAQWCAGLQRSDAKQATGEESGKPMTMSTPARLKESPSRQPLGGFFPRDGH